MAERVPPGIRIVKMLRTFLWRVSAGTWCWSFGHSWQMVGGRRCPRDCGWCTQPVLICKRCGEWDYGYPGGPGYKSCSTCNYQPEAEESNG